MYRQLAKRFSIIKKKSNKAGVQGVVQTSQSAIISMKMRYTMNMGRYDMQIIEIERLSRDYGEGRGIFDISFSIAEGEVFGFLGPNGAGKTTTIRHLL